MDGAAKLNKGLMMNETLRVLRLGQNPMQSQGAYLILLAVKNNPSIALVEIELTVCKHILFVKCDLLFNLCIYVLLVLKV